MPPRVDRLEASVAELNTRVETAMQETAGARNSVAYRRFQR